MQRLLRHLPLSASRNNAIHETLGRSRLRLTIAFAYVVSAIAYFSWRLTVLNPDAMVYSLLFLAGEFFGTIVCFILAFTGWRRVAVKAKTAAPGLSVDVFITVYNEPIDIVRSTVLGAVAADYPHETWILDDGNSAAMKEMAAELGCRYLARTTNEGAKAGNLNNGLRHAKGAFVAVLDADHVPQRDFLTRLLGYFDDPLVAMVQTPQDYYNLNGFQYGRDKYKKLIWHDQSVFHYVGQPGRNNWNAATFCGTSAILRRSAIDDIGGIPEETVTEDMHASVKMQRLGYRTVFHAEPLAYGVAPMGMRDYVRQRLRWGEGNMQVHRIEGLPFSSGLTWTQRLAYSALAWQYLSAWQKLIYVAAPIILLFLQVPPIVSDFATFLSLFLPYLFLTYLMFEEIGRGYGNFLRAEKFEIARIVAGLFATAGLFRRKIQFRVSSKETAGQVPWLLLTPQIAICVLSLASVSYAIFKLVTDPRHALVPWLAIIIIAIALLNAYLAYRVVVSAVGAARQAERNYRTVIDLPVRISSTGALVMAKELSTTEIVMQVSGGLGLGIGHRVPLTLFLPETQVVVDAVVDRIEEGEQGHIVKAGLLWTGLRQRDQLDTALHAGRWYRPITGYHEASRTPYDILKDLLDTGSITAPPPAEWRPALFTPFPDVRGRPQLGYMCADRDSDGTANEFILFGPASVGQCFQVDTPDDMTDSPRIICRMESELFGTVLDEDAFHVAGGHVFAAVGVTERELREEQARESTPVLRLPVGGTRQT